MAMAARSERATIVRSRVHGGDPAEPRVMVKRTAAVAHIEPRPQLVVVPHRRRTARLIAAGCTLVFGLMLGAAAFQTQLARRQLTIDQLDRGIRSAHEQYDVLRRERAELRSPGRLEQEAKKLDMVPARQTEFVTIDPEIVSELQRSGGDTGENGEATVDEQFEQYAEVKAEAGGAP